MCPFCLELTGHWKRIGPFAESAFKIVQKRVNITEYPCTVDRLGRVHRLPSIIKKRYEMNLTNETIARQWECASLREHLETCRLKDHLSQDVRTHYQL